MAKTGAYSRTRRAILQSGTVRPLTPASLSKMAGGENPFQAAQTIDPEVRAYVYSLVTAVSYRATPDATMH